MSQRPPFEELEHVSEVALRIYGRSWPELLEHAARGMFHLITEEPGQGPRTERQVRVEAGDREALLVEWLSELLTLHDTHGEVYDAFELEEVTPERVVGKVRGRPLRGGRLQIKAVTYHDLELAESGRGLEARVTFDV